VIVAVIAVRMMQPVTDQIVDMLAVRHRLMPATRAVLVATVVSGRRLGVLRRMRFVDGQRVLIDMVVVGVMQVPLV
jgi:hypothetical protein